MAPVEFVVGVEVEVEFVVVVGVGVEVVVGVGVGVGVGVEVVVEVGVAMTVPKKVRERTVRTVGYYTIGGHLTIHVRGLGRLKAKTGHHIPCTISFSVPEIIRTKKTAK